MEVKHDRFDGSDALDATDKCLIGSWLGNWYYSLPVVLAFSGVLLHGWAETGRYVLLLLDVGMLRFSVPLMHDLRFSFETYT